MVELTVNVAQEDKNSSRYKNASGSRERSSLAWSETYNGILALSPVFQTLFTLFLHSSPDESCFSILLSTTDLLYSTLLTST